MLEGDEHRVAEAYGSNYDRLARIKQQFDPTNLIRPMKVFPRVDDVIGRIRARATFS